MKNEAEQSNPSSGSVGEPMAFAVVQPDSYVVVHTRLAAVVMRETCAGGEVVPLYRQPQPTLTDAEREAIEWAIERTASMYDDPDGGPMKREALRDLLRRAK